MQKKIFVLGISLIGLSSNIYAYNWNYILNKKITYQNSFLDPTDRFTIKQFLEMLLTSKFGINLNIKDKFAKSYLNKKMPYINWKNVKIKDILKYLLGDKNFFYSFKDNTLNISYFQTRMYNLDFVYNVTTGNTTLDATNNKISTTYNFDFFKNIKNHVETLLKNNEANKDEFHEPILDKAAGILTVTGTKKQLAVVDQYIKKLMNRLTKEVLIDVRMYSVELSSSHQTGIDWSKLNISLNGVVPVEGKYIFGKESVFNQSQFNVNGLLNFLATNGNVNSISNPKIVALNNQKAIVSVGDTIYYKYPSKVTYDQNGNPITEYTIDSKFVGVTLDITPEISNDNTVILSINPKISSFKDITQLTNNNRGMPPDTTDKNLYTVVRLKNNQTLVMGGLITNDKTLKVNGVPVLEEIPIVKYLFSSKEQITDKKEFVFVITPHIINLSSKIPLEKIIK